jgi:hypothetical protein
MAEEEAAATSSSCTACSSMAFTVSSRRSRR